MGAHLHGAVGSLDPEVLNRVEAAKRSGNALLDERCGLACALASGKPGSRRPEEVRPGPGYVMSERELTQAAGDGGEPSKSAIDQPSNESGENTRLKDERKG